ncbi:MAG: hypothetical protein PHD13_00555 [Methanocellales archaeon]|nr:hypothetical protein [Methanocellales archaeon]MDD3291453.1 hypothetical protein [Methanocellales archaeon]MDD5234657.1 hypothetical protein [Methanocellales archaeon]MDD5484990.1 hypothetical protein [Methanocellales archaeon]
MTKKKLTLAISMVVILVLAMGVGSSKVNSTPIEDAVSIDEVIVQDSAILTEEAMINEVLRDEQITAEELKKLYDRGVKIIAVETTEDPEVINHVKTQMKDYSLIIPGCLAAELDRLIAMDYEKAHGYLPEETGITPDSITEEELKKLIEEGKVEMGDAPAVQTKSLKSPGNPDVPPYQYNGNIYVDLYPAEDEDHAPAGGANWNDVAAALSPFEDEFGVNMIQNAYYNEWDASDVGDSVYDLLDDLEDDIPNSAANMVTMGWVDNADHNGVAQLSGYYSVCAESPVYWRANWPDDSVAQHELSHNFDAEDQADSGGECTDSCIMDHGLLGCVLGNRRMV